MAAPPSDLAVLFDGDFAISGPDETEVRIKCYALVSLLEGMDEAERLRRVGRFYEMYLGASEPCGAMRIVAEHLRPFFLEQVRLRRDAINSDPRYAARAVDELHAIGTPEALELMLALPSSEALRMYAVRKFPLREQRRAVGIMRGAGVRPISLRALGSEFYDASVVEWMLEGFVRRVSEDPECMSGLDFDPPTLSASPLLRNMDTVYQLHRQGFFGRAELYGWWRAILRALRPAADKLAPVDAFLVDQGDPVGLVDSVLRLVTDAGR